MRRLLFILCLLGICGTAIAQENYDISLMPKNLLPYASAVVRNEEITTEVKDLDYSTYHVKRAIVVLNKNGDEKVGLDIFYNKNISIKYIKGTIYNQYGKAIQKISERDFDDYAATDGFSLFQDDRVKHYKKATTDYPYTVEYEFELKDKQSLIFHDWSPNSEVGLAVEKSSYTFICKPDFNIRYKQFNLSSNAIISTNKDGNKTYTWQTGDVKARKDEPFSPYIKNTICRVTFAPEKFTYYSINGAFTNWQQLGKWEYDKLVAIRQQLPPETIQHVQDITKDISDPKLKAKKIYEYMQQKTHYVSVQIGIGGYQPFLASDVDKLNYGDCKALVNYTQALLKAVNVDSYYCVVESGRNYKVSMLDDFPSMNQGNHIILCLPFKNDTTWADCTSQTIPFGYLGSFTDDRTVLACTPDGGKLMHTPKYTAEENLEKRKASFVLNNSGELTGDMETTFKGATYEFKEQTIQEAQTERIKDVKRAYPINNLEIQKLEYKQDKSLKPYTIEDIKLSAPEYAAVNNSEIYFSLNSFDRARPLRQLQNRTNPVYINRGYTDEDEVTYTLPKGYHLESEPLEKHIDKAFGSFSATMTINGDQLVYKRKFQIKDGNYSKDVYQDMVDFYQSVADADEYNVRLTKN
jgi:hypothetical protein